MKKRKKRLYLLLLGFILLMSPMNIAYGEGFDTWKEVIYYDENFEDVKIEFNKPIDGRTVEDGLKLYENGEQIDFSYELQKNKTLLKITPKIENYSPENKYELRLNKFLKAEDGKTLGNNLRANFYIEKESVVNQPEEPVEIPENNPMEKILEALKSYEKTVYFYPENLKVEDIQDYIDLEEISYLVYKNPDIDLGYGGVGMKYYHNSKGEVVRIILNIKYLDYGEEVSQDILLKKKKELDMVVENFIDDYIVSGMTDLEKEIAIHDYIVKNAEYNINAAANSNNVSKDNFTAYGVLVNGTGVCDSYAKAFYTLGKAAGLDVRYIRGQSISNGRSVGHAWNIINLDGDWYTVDTTWNDPIPAEGWNKPLDYVRYKYFNVTDDMIRNSHIRDDYFAENYPKSEGTKYGRDALYEQGIIEEYRTRSLDEELFILPNAI